MCPTVLGRKEGGRRKSGERPFKGAGAKQLCPGSAPVGLGTGPIPVLSHTPLESLAPVALKSPYDKMREEGCNSSLRNYSWGSQGQRAPKGQEKASVI